jgi:hypothetical protein
MLRVSLEGYDLKKNTKIKLSNCHFEIIQVVTQIKNSKNLILQFKNLKKLYFLKIVSNLRK